MLMAYLIKLEHHPKHKQVTTLCRLPQ